MRGIDLNKPINILGIFLVLVFSAALLTNFASAQAVNPSVSVYVGQCSSSLPIAFAVLNIDGTSYSSNQLGYITLNSLNPNQAYYGVLSATGYQPLVVSLTAQQFSNNNYQYCLASSTPGFSSPLVSAKLVYSNGVNSNSGYTLFAQSSDVNSQISYTQLSYSIGSGATQNFFCQSNSCSVQIPQLPNGQTITYYAQATNMDGLTSSTSNIIYQVQSGSVSNQFTSASTLLPAISLYRTPTDSIVSANTPITVVATSQSQNTIVSTTLYYQISNQGVSSQVCYSNYCSVTLNSVPSSSTVYYWASSTDSNSLTSTTSKLSFQTSPVSSTNSNFTVHVLDCSTGAYLPNSAVSLIMPNGSNYYSITDSSANAVFSNILSGTYLVSVENSGYSVSSLNYTLYQSVNSQINVCLTSQYSYAGFPSVSVLRSPAGQVNYNQVVSLSANSSSPNGIIYTAIAYSVDNQGAQSQSCSSSNCHVTVGPFQPGDVVTYWAYAKQNGANNLVGYTPTYSFNVGPFATNQTNTGSSNNSISFSSSASASSCAVYVQENTGASNNSVSVNYYNYSQSPSFASISCGNGQTFNAQCQTTSSNNSTNSGICYSSTNYCDNYQANANYQISSSVSNVTCSPYSFSTSTSSSTSRVNGSGSLSVTVLDSSTYAPVSLAQLSVDGLYAQTNSFGQATFQMVNGSYTLQSSAKGYVSNNQNVSVSINQTSQIEILLTPTSSINSCSIEAELASNSCNAGIQSFSIRVQQNSSTAQYASISLASALSVSGPTKVYLPDSNGYYLNYSLSIPSSYSGVSNIQALVSSNSTNCQSANLNIPLCPTGSISASFVSQNVNALPSTTSCTQAIITNNGINSQQVTLSPSGNYPVTISPSSLIIGGQSSQQVNYCVSLPVGADGTNAFSLNVNGNNGLLSTASYQLSSFGQSSFSLNYSTCNSTANSSGPSGLYSVTATANGYTSATQEIYVQQDYPNVASMCLSETSSSTTTPPQVEVFRSPTSTVVSGATVRLIADASSSAGISQLRIFYSVNNGQAQQASCNTDTCSVSIGPFNTGDSVTYYAQAIDSSSNYNSATTNTQSFTVQAQTLYSQYSLPSISLSISPNGIIYPTSAIYITANASGSYNIQSTDIFYRVGQGSWHSSTCFANTCSFYLGSYPVGTTVYYYATATDTAAPANSVQTDIFTATVQPISPSAIIGNLLLYVYDCNTLAPLSTATVSVSGATSNFQTNANGYANIFSSTFSSAVALTYNNALCPCISLPADSQSVVPISVYASGPSSDYQATIDSGYNNLVANTVEPNLYGFGNGQWRTTYLNINTNGVSSGNYSLTFGLNALQTGSSVYSSNICFYVPSVADAQLQVNPLQISLSSGQSVPVSVRLTNTGNDAQNFLLFASTNQYFTLSLQSTQINLQPGQSISIPATITAYSNVPLGNYQVTLNANDQNGGLIQSTQIPINVVSYQQTTTTPLSGIDVSILSSKPIPTSGVGLVPIVITNNNLYPVDGLTVFISNLPAGAVSKVAGPLNIPALATANAIIEVDTNSIPAGFYPAQLTAQSSTDSFNSNIYLPIGVSISPLYVQVSTPSVSYSFSNGTQISLNFNVSNSELGPLNITAFMDNLPSGYTQSASPGFAVIQPNSSSEFQINLYSADSPTSNFNSSIVVLSSSGRLARFPITLSPLDASSATGFFLFSYFGNTGIILIVALLLIAGALFYLARNRLEDAIVYHQSKKSSK